MTQILNNQYLEGQKEALNKLAISYEAVFRAIKNRVANTIPKVKKTKAGRQSAVSRDETIAHMHRGNEITNPKIRDPIYAETLAKRYPGLENVNMENIKSYNTKTPSTKEYLKDMVSEAQRAFPKRGNL